MIFVDFTLNKKLFLPESAQSAFLHLICHQFKLDRTSMKKQIVFMNKPKNHGSASVTSQK